MNRRDTAAAPGWRRRAQVLLGTLVEVGVPASGREIDRACFGAAFEAIVQVQSCLSRFDPDSDVSRFHALPAGACLALRPVTRRALVAARELQLASAGQFDISLGSATDGWCLQGGELHKLDPAVRLDLGGIGKGLAVDLAIEALQAGGCRTGWVNAGGDLRVFGEVELPLHLRDEHRGGVRPFALLRDGAFATSAFGPAHRSLLAGRGPSARHDLQVSVAAPACMHADALTKIVALSGDASHPLLDRFGASAWFH